LVVQSVSTWNCPYHFETLSIEIMGMALPQRMTAIFSQGFTAWTA
jgi:hypothetical protein